MNLSKNFTLEELTHTDTGLPNVPTEAEKEKLLYLANYILQPIRGAWGPLKVTSGYRCHEVNRTVGSKDDSQHTRGEAVDFQVMEFNHVEGMAVRLDAVFKWLISRGIPSILFGQCIRESRGGADWIHISLPRLNKQNQEALIYDGKTYQLY